VGSVIRSSDYLDVMERVLGFTESEEQASPSLVSVDLRPWLAGTTFTAVQIAVVDGTTPKRRNR
jgi:hypothetical protein